mmetsp:Transcript_27458/g.68981  ORF Transcript_27458/g.68981 Transcript_27458/m.68981 type:complete len:244 (-) Transcript_27458:165-896(-)
MSLIEDRQMAERTRSFPGPEKKSCSWLFLSVKMFFITVNMRTLKKKGACFSESPAPIDVTTLIRFTPFAFIAFMTHVVPSADEMQSARRQRAHADPHSLCLAKVGRACQHRRADVLRLAAQRHHDAVDIVGDHLVDVRLVGDRALDDGQLVRFELGACLGTTRAWWQHELRRRPDQRDDLVASIQSLENTLASSASAPTDDGDLRGADLQAAAACGRPAGGRRRAERTRSAQGDAPAQRRRRG